MRLHSQGEKHQLLWVQASGRTCLDLSRQPLVASGKLSTSMTPFMPRGLPKVSAVSYRERLWSMWMTCWTRKNLPSPAAKELLFRVPRSSSAWVADTAQPSLLKARGKPPSSPAKVKRAFPVFTPQYSYLSPWLHVLMPVFPVIQSVLPLVTFVSPSDPTCLPHVQKDSLLWSAFSSLKKISIIF